MDIVTAVTTLQSAHFQPERLVAFRHGNQLVIKLDSGVNATGTADAILTFVLVVEIQQYLALEPALAKTCGAGETGLLVDGNQGLHGRVLQFLVL